MRPTIGFFTPDFSYQSFFETWLGMVSAAQKEDVNLVYLTGGYIGREWPMGTRLRHILFDLTKTGSLDGLITFHFWHELEDFEYFYQNYAPFQ